VKRQSPRLDRRFLPRDSLTTEQREELANRITFVGKNLHKLRPGDYGLDPPVNPRPSKSVCDDLRPVLKAEATKLLREGAHAGMVSTFVLDGVPKYVWAVDDAGEVWEAKTAPGLGTAYYGYRLGDDDTDMRKLVKKEWTRRCRTD